MERLPEVALDTRDPSFVEDPYPRLRELTETAPLVRDTVSGLVLVTRYAEVHACLRDRRLGRAVEPVTTREALGLEPHDPRWQSFWDLERWSLLELEPPDHRRLRGLVAQAFTPRAVEALRQPATDLAHGLLDGLDDRDGFDLLADFAQPYSVAVITRLLGVPADRGPDLLAWSHAMVRMYELATPEAEAVAANEASAAFDAYVRELVAERRADPRDDLVTGLVQAETEDGRLSDDEIVSTVVVLLNAGHEATVNTIGNGMRTLLDTPDEWRRVTSGEVAPEVVVEEMLRHDAPLQLFERWVLADDVEVAGHHLDVGSKIAMLFGAANRDPHHFSDPDLFDAARNPRDHIGFGGGIHHCIGAPLARLELATAVAALAERTPGLTLTAEPRRTGAFVIRGYASVPVTS